jgi:hypothetical protein
MVPISYLPAISMNLHFESSDDDGTSGPGESVVSSSTINSVEEEDDQSMDADSVEVEQGTPDSDGSIEASKEGKVEIPCEFCGQVPCDVVIFWDNICEVCDDLKDNGMANNQVRFHAYREYTRLKHGVLRRHDRRPLPMCVRSEIQDSWPDPNGTYVGFQAAIKHAAEDSE